MKRDRGFSLVELIIAIVIFSILVKIALPMWSNYVADNKLKLIRDSFVSSVDMARQMALSNDDNVTLCPFSAASSTTCGADWNSGWIVYEQTAASGNILLRTVQAPSNTKIAMTATNPAVTSLTFSPKPPFLNHATDFKLCDARGASSAMAISIQLTGYVQYGQTQGYAVDGQTPISCP